MGDAFELAQINIGRLAHPLDAPETRDFIDNLDRVNALAEANPGFVWRLAGDGGNATDIRAFDDPMMILNMSVWRDVESLAAFVYRTAHRSVMRRRREWFHPLSIYMALWWTPAGHRPTPVEAIARLGDLEREGPTPRAFTFARPFAPPGELTMIHPILDRCA